MATIDCAMCALEGMATPATKFAYFDCYGFEFECPPGWYWACFHCATQGGGQVFDTPAQAAAFECPCSSSGVECTPCALFPRNVLPGGG